MNDALGLLETTGLTPAMAALDIMMKSADIQVLQAELNDSCGVCVKITGSTADVQTAIEAGSRVADKMRGSPVARVLTRVSASAWPAIQSPPEFSPLIQQAVVIEPSQGSEPPVSGTEAEIKGSADKPPVAGTRPNYSQSDPKIMSQETPMALGFIETQGFTAAFEAIDTACKAASVEVVGKEKLGGGYVTIVIQGQLSAVTAAVESGSRKVESLGKLIAAHVIARPSEAVLKLLPKV